MTGSKIKSLERLQTSLSNSLNQSIQVGKNAKCKKKQQKTTTCLIQCVSEITEIFWIIKKEQDNKGSILEM